MGSIDRIRSLAKKYRGEDDEEEEIKISERKETDNREEILKKAKKDMSVSSSVKKNNNSDLKQPSYRNNKKVNMEIQDTPITTPTEATTISQSEIKANNEAEEMNKDIEEGGYKKANAIISNTLTSFAGGVKTGASGIANAVMLPTASLLQKINKLAQIKNEKKDDTWLKKASDNILNKAEELSNTANYDNFRNSRIQNNVARTAGTVSSVVGNMVPSIASNFVAPGSGLAVMGVSAGGNSAQETLNDRRDNLDKAITTGVLKGAVEVATEKLTGGNFLSKGSLDDLATKSISKISSKPLQKILSKGYEYGGEVLEEQISDIAGYIIDKVINNQELPDLKTFWDNANETTKTTLLSTAVLNLFGLGGSTYKEVQEYSNNKDIERYLPEIESVVNKESDNIASNLEIKLNDKIQENQINKILNNKDLPMQSFQYETSKNTKINNLREDANKYFNNSKEAHSYVNMLENIITDKNIDIRLDGNLMTPDGRTANGSYSNGVITINPNSSKTGEFIAIHELTHAIGTDQMKNIINNYRKSNVDFDNSVKQFLNNYNSTEISEEALSDVSAQLFGTQEFIDNIAQNNPNIFQRIYSEIEYLWHQFKGYKTQNQFVNDLYYKWTQAYNSDNILNSSESYSIEQSSKGRYVKADRQVITGNDPLKWETQVENYINSNIRQGKDIQVKTENGDILTITKDTAGKAKFRNQITDKNGNTRYLNNKEFLSKLTAETHIDELAEVSKKINKQPIPDYKNHNFAKDGFDYRSAYFEDFDGQYYKITMSVGKSGNIDTIYNIGKMDKKNRSKSSLVAQRPSDKNITSNEELTSTSSITSSNKDVNTTTKYSMQESENNTLWQDYLEKNYKTTGTRTNLEDIRIAPKAKKDILDTDKIPTVQQKSSAIQSLPVGEYTGKQRKHYKSIIESQETTPQAKKIARELLKSDSYVPETNKGQLEQADARIMSSTPDSELKSLSARSINGEKITSVDIAVGERLIQYYSKTGDAVKLQEAIQSTAMAGTTAGQTVQALSLLNHQTPQGQAMWLQKSVDRMNNELAQRRGGKIQKDDNGNIRVINKKGIDITEKVELFNFTPEMTQKIVSSKNDVELHNNLNEVYEQLGQQVTKTTLQKIDSWRYFAMLANPRTHIRNIVGNTAMATMQYGIKNKVAGAIEGVVSKFNPEIERTHTIVPASSEVKQFAKNDINNVLDRLGLTENKYNPKSRLENSMRTFKSDSMENTVGKLFDLNDRALEAEDGWGLKAGYKKALADYMTANKLTPENITDKQLAKARNYAVEQAKEATFHQENQLAALINQLSNKNKFAKYTTDAILPFKKTPMNIAKLGLEYSPIGLAKSAVYDTVQLRKGNITVNKYIDNVSKGLTGTGIALVGYALAQSGILRASGSDDKEKADYDEAMGNQTYSIKIGDNTYSLDWIAPSGIPLFIGAEIWEIMQSKNEIGSKSTDDEKTYKQAINSAVNILDGFTNAMNPMTEMSMLSGLTSALQSYQQGSSQMLANMGTNAVKSYVNQFVPTALGQIAKITDDYDRSTSTTATGVLPKAIESTKNQIIAKIPGARQSLPKKTNIWGKEVKQPENIVRRALETAVLPYTRKSISTSKVDEEISRVYKNTGESSVLPDNINKYLTIDKQKYIMTSDEYSKYKKESGKISYNLLNNLISSENYKKMSDNQKQIAIEQVYKYSREKVKMDYSKQNKLDCESSKLYNTIEELDQKKGNSSNYFEYLALTSDMHKDKEKLETLVKSNYNATTKMVIYENNLKSSGDVKYDIIKSSGLDINEYLKYRLEKSKGTFDSDKKDDGTINGKTISGSAKKKVYSYVEGMKATYMQKILLYGLDYTPSKSDKETIVNYISSIQGKSNQEKLDMLDEFSWIQINKNKTFKIK